MDRWWAWSWAAGILVLSLPALTVAENLPVRAFGAADGLRGVYIHQIRADREGFVWLLSPDGLARFDGSSFVSYGPEEGLAGQIVTDFACGGDGTRLVSTVPGGIYRMGDRTRGPFLDKLPLGELPMILQMIPASDGSFLCATKQGLLSLSRRGTRWQTRALNLGEPTPHLIAVAIDIDGAIWAGGATGGLNRIKDGEPPTRWMKKDGLPDDRIVSLMTGETGEMWVGTPAGLAVIRSDVNKTRFSIREVPLPKDQSGSVFALARTSDGAVWAGTYGGLVRLARSADDPDGWSVEAVYQRAEGLSDNSIKSLLDDQAGNLWIGTEHGAAMRLPRDRLQNWGVREGLKGDRFAQLIESRDGRMCVINGQHQVALFGGERFIECGPDLSGIERRGWGWSQMAFERADGEWWIGTGQGVARFAKVERPELLARERPVAVYTSRDGLGSDDVYSLYEDSRGDVWVGTYADPGIPVLARRDNVTGRFAIVEPPAGVSWSTPTAFCESPPGRLWIGLYGGGVIRQQGGSFEMVTQEQGLPAGFVTSLFRDARGRLWIGTAAGGLGCIDDPKAASVHVRCYTTRDGLSSNEIRAIVADLYGRLYLGTPRCVDRFDPETGAVKRYTTAEGLAEGAVDALYRDRHGNIWVATNHGVSRLIVRPDPLRQAPPVFLSGLHVDGQPYRLGELGSHTVEGIELTAGRLQVEYLGVSQSVNDPMRYRYRLVGAEEDWSDATTQRVVNYARLAPGRYRFQVRAAENAGSARTAEVAFRVLPPIWLRWWFLSISVGALTLAAYSFHRARLSRLRELLAVRTRIARDLHDDIAASLSGIAILSESLKPQVGDARPEIQARLGTIADSAREMVDAMSDVVWAVDPRQDDVASVIGRVRYFATDVLGARGILFEMNAPADLERVRLNSEARRHLLLVFKEAVNNAARHSGCSAVTIRVTTQPGRIAATVADNGRGMDVSRDSGHAHRPGGHGLGSMRSRVEGLGGRFAIEPNPGGGTRVSFEIPTRR